MTSIEAARKVVSEKQCHLLRPRKDSAGEYDAKSYDCGSKRGWFYLDLFSASAIVNVHDALSEQNRAKFAAMPLPKMASVAFKLIK